MPNSAGPSSQSGGGNPALQVQPITPQLLTNAQGQIIATVIGNQILPVINTQGITLSPIKPGQQVTWYSDTKTSIGSEQLIFQLPTTIQSSEPRTQTRVCSLVSPPRHSFLSFMHTRFEFTLKCKTGGLKSIFKPVWRIGTGSPARMLLT